MHTISLKGEVLCKTRTLEDSMSGREIARDMIAQNRMMPPPIVMAKPKKSDACGDSWRCNRTAVK